MHAGRAWETMGNNGFGNFRAGHYHWDRLGRQWETMDLVTFGLGITTGTGLGGNGRQYMHTCTVNVYMCTYACSGKLER